MSSFITTNKQNASASPVYECGLYEDTYICTGAQYQLYCNTSVHNFWYSGYLNQITHRCSGYGCDCTGNTNTCTCTSSTSSCFCKNYKNHTSPSLIPRYDCELYENSTYICTGVHYSMYCDINDYELHYTLKHHHCLRNNCDCQGDMYDCDCYQSKNSTCLCTKSVNTTTTPTPTSFSPTTASLNLTLLKNCTGTECITNLLDLIENTTELPLKTVTDLLDVVFNASVNINSSLDDPMKLMQAGNQALKASEKLVSMLVKETNTSERVSLIRETVAAQVFMVGPQVTLNKTSNLTLDQIPQLNTTNASIDIDLIGNALNNNGSAAVAFMSYSTMEDLLKPDFFNKSNNTVNTMMSTVISATLPKTTNTTLTKPVNFTLKHIRELNDTGNLFCVYWNISEWIVDGCSLVNTNSSDTVCSCLHLSTFALIMQTSSSPPEDNPLMEILNLVFVIVGLVFTSLALLTFAFCRWKPGVNNVARINLCISLLSAHLLFLLTQQFIKLIKPHKELCAVISGALHFFFLSCFVWMFIEAVLLFICVKNLSQISSKQRAVLNSGFLIVIGYAIAFVIVGVSVGLVPEGYGSEKCWIKPEQGFIWSFLGPVCFILAINTILFISIISILNSTLKNLNAEVSLTKQTKIMVFKTLAQSVILGCPWILGFFVNYSEMIEIIFLILNSQQGTFIFLIYCFLNDEVRQQYMEWIRAVFP
nr:adhesion G protein-coupled receptor E3-like [Misgurnus anguillicaudatus]